MIRSSSAGTSGFSRTAGTGGRFRIAVEDDSLVSPRNGIVPGRHLIQHRTEGEQIGARIQLFRAHLLRRHVGDGAHRRARTGQMLLVDRCRRRVGRCDSGWTNWRRRHLRQSEIENLGVPALGDENVGGLDVAMNDALGVRGVERVGNLNGQSEQHVRSPADRPAMRCFRVTPSRNSMAMKRLPVVLANLVDGADVGVIQGGGGTRFAAEAFQRLRVLRDLVGEKLERDKAAELGVLGLVNHTHAAAAELLDDAVVGDGLADHAQGCYGGNVGKSMWVCPQFVGVISRLPSLTGLLV